MHLHAWYALDVTLHRIQPYGFTVLLLALVDNVHIEQLQRMI